MFTKLHEYQPNLDFINNIKITESIQTIIIILFIGWSIIMSILTQVIFDSFIKYNYESNIYTITSDNLTQLRQKVINQLAKENEIFSNIEQSDYFLYQVISRKISFFEPDTKTNNYVNEAKIGGILFLSIMTAIIINIFLFDSSFWLLLVLMPIYFFGHEFIKSRYRARAIRIYINYLIGDEKK
jgi:hypothetical protein